MLDVFFPNVWVLINYYLFCLRVLLTDLGTFSGLTELPVSVTCGYHEISTLADEVCVLRSSLLIEISVQLVLSSHCLYKVCETTRRFLHSCAHRSSPVTAARILPLG